MEEPYFQLGDTAVVMGYSEHEGLRDAKISGTVTARGVGCVRLKIKK